jgi:hypothetical protein
MKVLRPRDFVPHSMSPASTFCSSCQLLLYDPSNVGGVDPTDSNGFIQLNYDVEDEYPSLSKFTQSAKDGCRACGFLVKAIHNHCMSDPLLFKGSTDTTSASNLRLVLSRFYHLGVQFLRDPSTVGPWYISGTLSLDNVSSAIRLDVRDAQGEFLG